MTSKVREHNEYFRTVSLSKRKSCPYCYAKLAEGESVWSWGEYHAGKWRTVKYFCQVCFERNVKGLLLSHTDTCRCVVNLVGYGSEKLPTWLHL